MSIGPAGNRCDITPTGPMTNRWTRKFVQRLRKIAESGGLASPTLQSKVADIIPSGTTHGGAAIETIVDDAEHAEFAVRLKPAGC